MHTGTLILALLLTSALPAHAHAQPAQSDETPRRLEQIKARLALTPEQVEQVRPVLAEEGQKLRALREKHTAAEGMGGGSRRDRLKLARELRSVQNDADKQLEKILSKEQMTELKKMREETREQLRARAGRG